MWNQLGNEAMYKDINCITYIPGFLKTELAKISTHSTTWQLKTIKLVQRPIKSLYLTPGSKLMVPRSIPMSPNLKWGTFYNIYSVIWLREVSNRCRFSLQIFKLSSAWLRLTWQIASKTQLFSRSDKQQDFAWNRQQTEWNTVHKLSPSYLQKPAYGSMSLEPAETRPTSNFPESRVCFSKVQSAKINTKKTILMAGTKYFGETAAQPRDHIPVNTMRKSHNHTLSRHW